MKDFNLPTNVVFEHDEVNTTYGKFIAKPFERGFATTIGNSLRRTLLSSIPGSAIVAIKIHGVHHEFSTIPGVVEDTTDLIINLKNVRIKLADDIEKKVIHIEKKGSGKLLAKELETDSSVKILNPQAYIATLNNNAHLVMDIQINRGRGYVPSEELKEIVEEDPNIIVVDAIFSPILKVNYKIDNIRLGQKIDYEKLILELWTDGSITPDNAMAQAGKILKEHFNRFLNFVDNEELIQLEDKPKQETNDEIIDKILSTPVEELELSVRASNCLSNTKIKSIGELIKLKEEDLMEMKNFGKKSADELKDKLKNYGLWLGMKPEDLKNIKIKKEKE